MAKKVFRLPTNEDVDEYGMVAIQVETKKGLKIRRVAAVDAREIILAGLGTLDIGNTVVEKEKSVKNSYEMLRNMKLADLRELAESKGVPFKSLGTDDLAHALAEAGIEPDLEVED